MQYNKEQAKGSEMTVGSAKYITGLMYGTYQAVLRLLNRKSGEEETSAQNENKGGHKAHSHTRGFGFGVAVAVGRSHHFQSSKYKQQGFSFGSFDIL